MEHLMLVYQERAKCNCTRLAKVLKDRAIAPIVQHSAYKDWWGVYVSTFEYQRAYEIVWGTDGEVA